MAEGILSACIYTDPCSPSLSMWLTSSVFTATITNGDPAKDKKFATAKIADTVASLLDEQRDPSKMFGDLASFCNFVADWPCCGADLMSDLEHIHVLANAACGGGDVNAVDGEFLALATRWAASGPSLAQVLKTSRPHGPRLLEGGGDGQGDGLGQGVGGCGEGH